MGSDASDPERERAVAEWRMRHRLAADDPIVLVTELLDLYARYHGGSLPTNSGDAHSGHVAGWAAVVAVVLAAVGGFILGRVWR